MKTKIMNMNPIQRELNLLRELSGCRGDDRISEAERELARLLEIESLSMSQPVQTLIRANHKRFAYVLAIEGDFGSEALFFDGGYTRRHQGAATALKMLEKFARKERRRGNDH